MLRNEQIFPYVVIRTNYLTGNAGVPTRDVWAALSVVVLEWETWSFLSAAGTRYSRWLHTRAGTVLSFYCLTHV